jgi:hypothetical protein
LPTACKQDQDRTSWSCSQAVRKPVWRIPTLFVQWKTPDDGQTICPKHTEFHSKNKFEKLVHLIGFIIRNLKYVLIYFVLLTGPCWVLNSYPPSPFHVHLLTWNVCHHHNSTDCSRITYVLKIKVTQRCWPLMGRGAMLSY